MHTIRECRLSCVAYAQTTRFLLERYCKRSCVVYLDLVGAAVGHCSPTEIRGVVVGQPVCGRIKIARRGQQYEIALKCRSTIDVKCVRILAGNFRHRVSPS